jgi:ribonuclease P protein component
VEKSNHVEAHIPTEQSSPGENTWLSRADGDQKWSSGAEKTACQGAQASHAGALLTLGRWLSKLMRLRDSGEFRRVYSRGKRYDSHLMTAFVHPNGLSHHRLGITASRKAIGNAVERNRSKRLLRETFRLSDAALDALPVKYDLVLNAKRSLLGVKVAASLEEFQKIIARVSGDERGAQKIADE